MCCNNVAARNASVAEADRPVIRRHTRVVRANRLQYYNVQADAAFWDRHWRETIGTALYAEAGRNGLAYLEIPFTRYLPRAGKILEAGCGSGYYVAALRARGYDVEGVDFAAETIAAIRRACPGLPVKAGDVTKLPVPDGYYSAYISLGVVEHRQEGPEPFLREAHRVLASGGVALISVPWFHSIRQLKARFGLYRGATDGLEFYQQAFTVTEFRTLLIAAGFSVVEMSPYDGYKGLKDEVPFVRWLLAQRMGPRLQRWMVNSSWATKWFGHMALFVCSKA
jgi:SAM-dependent methyltransferase